ncbi:MAG: hypothetical protein LOD88_02320 [Novibacillus thermophilus]
MPVAREKALGWKVFNAALTLTSFELQRGTRSTSVTAAGFFHRYASEGFTGWSVPVN